MFFGRNCAIQISLDCTFGRYPWTQHACVKMGPKENGCYFVNFSSLRKCGFSNAFFNGSCCRMHPFCFLTWNFLCMELWTQWTSYCLVYPFSEDKMTQLLRTYRIDIYCDQCCSWVGCSMSIQGTHRSKDLCITWARCSCGYSNVIRIDQILVQLLIGIIC